MYGSRIEDTKRTDFDRCLRCGRKLKNEEARKIGYGIICLEKMKIKKTRKLF